MAAKKRRQSKSALLKEPEPSGDAPSPLTESAPTTLRSAHTESFPALLKHLGASVMVTTYQAGKLVMLRSDGDVLNTHFRGFGAPMGLAVAGDRLAIGTGLEVWEFHNAPAVAARLEPPGKHDACFLPRGSHTTGNIQIHEMAWGDTASRERDRLEPELWFVNTRFSCLCTRDRLYSFVPRWRPPFISAIAPEDRCHLNGLAMRDGQPHAVTALGVSDEPGGWRQHKRAGGVIIDVPSGEIVAQGLSMPHSPRYYRDRLWVLNSGAGGLGTIDPRTGDYQSVAELPGFTRGLDFCDRYAFIGLSQVRESAIFSGIAIADRPVSERCCGIWVVDVVTGETVASLKFEDGVQELFAVQVLPGVRFPDLVNDDRTRLADSFVLPDEPLDAVPVDYVRRSDTTGSGIQAMNGA